jgi:flagellin
MLAIKNNLMAVNAARHLGESYDALATSVERLSSGLRINSARDDAAGLAVRELMRADVAVLQQASRNALDGVSMVQAMEGSMSTIDDTGSYSSAQRAIMDNEFDEMAAEINRIAGAVAFNGNVLLNSASASIDIQVGTGATDQITIAGVDVTSSALGLTTASITTTGAAQSALATIDSAINAKDVARAAFGYKMNRLENTISVLNNQVENMMAAESRISDVDVAHEMSEMTKNQVLSQAGVAMLAQANSMPQMALILLR